MRGAVIFANLFVIFLFIVPTTQNHFWAFYKLWYDIEMNKLDMQDLLGRTIKELVQLRKENKEQLAKYRLQNSMRALNQPHLIEETKRDIARINTAITKKQKDLDSKNNK